MTQCILPVGLNTTYELTAFGPGLKVTQNTWPTITLATKRLEDNASVFDQYQINYRNLFFHCSLHHIVVFKATPFLTETNKTGYCQYVTFVYEKDSTGIWRMFLLIAYCHSLILEGRESMASDCYSHDEKGLQPHLINLLWNRMSHWHFKLSSCFVHRIILSLNSLGF